jgi:hypothetical protein
MARVVDVLFLFPPNIGVTILDRLIYGLFVAGVYKTFLPILFHPLHFF